MRIDRTQKQTPPSPVAGDAAEERFVWESLAPRLLQPSKLAFIQTLLRHGQPLTVSELAKAAGIKKGHAQHQISSMQRAGVLEVVAAVESRADEDAGEPSYYFPKSPQAAPSLPATKS
jgi:predicted transcriptional regulator